MSREVEPIRITLPPLHAGQSRIERSLARFIVVIIGRRFGKTTYGVRKCVKEVLKTGYTYWWVGPTYKEASIGWGMLKKLAWQLQEVLTIDIREGDMAVVFPNGGKIVIKSADNPDTLRGEKLGGVVLDEFPGIKAEAWFEVLRPSLADLRGWALFIGTPKGKNWAYKLAMQAKTIPNWEFFQIPTAVTEDGTANTKVIGTTNPWLVFTDGKPDISAAVDELEDARQTMSPEQFAQEFLADFGASQYLVLPELSEATHVWRGPVPKFISYHGGMDFGGDTIGAHKSVTLIGGRTERDEIILVAGFKQSGPNIAERQYNWTWEQELKLAEISRALHMPYEGVTYRADKSQMLGIQFMQRSGLRVLKTKGGPDSVMDGIELMHRRMVLRPEDGAPEDGKNRLKPRFYVLPELLWVLEDLMSYRNEEPKGDGRVEAKNPLKVDDDVADATRYLIEGVDRGPIGDPQQLYAGDVPRLA